MSIESAIAKIEKAFGTGIIRRLDEMPQMDVKVIDSGSLAINHALSVGGWPKSHIVELFGNEGSGKTTLCYHAVASAQKSGDAVAFIDVEHRVDREYARAIGVDTGKLLFSQPGSGEDAMEMVKTLLQEKAVGLIVIDSIAALTTQAELDGDFSDANIAAQARLMSKSLKQFSQLKTFSNCCLMFTNQQRERPGMMYGDPTYQPGGRGPKFYSSVRCKLKATIEKNEEGKAAYNTCTIKVVKNSCGIPFREAEFTIRYGQGIDPTEDAFTVALEKEIITKRGSWYILEGHNIGQSREKAINFFKDKDRTERLKKLVISQQEEK